MMRVQVADGTSWNPENPSRQTQRIHFRVFRNGSPKRENPHPTGQWNVQLHFARIHFRVFRNGSAKHETPCSRFKWMIHVQVADGTSQNPENPSQNPENPSRQTRRIHFRVFRNGSTKRENHLWGNGTSDCISLGSTFVFSETVPQNTKTRRGHGTSD
jgi:hypothetical protein